MLLANDTLSIVIPAYNEEKNIYNTLSLLEKQTITSFEVIVVDDGSTDKTKDLVKEFVATNFSLRLIEQNNQGAAKAREKAINLTDCKYVAFLDCDDSLSFDALEKAILPILNNNMIDISLFHLVYKDNLKSDIANEFEYFTDRSECNGNDVFVHSISTWGVHAFGIYNKELIKKAYSEYKLLNKTEENYLNNDEIISRVSFFYSRNIYLSNGVYFFINNESSTTRRVNQNYYRTILNSFLLLEFVQEKYIYDGKTQVICACCKLIISSIWGVFKRFTRWRYHFSVTVKQNWFKLIKLSITDIKNYCRAHNVSLPLKSRVQLFILTFLINLYE